MGSQVDGTHCHRIIDGVGRVVIHSPLEQDRLSFITTQLEGPLEGSESGEQVGWMTGIYYPSAQFSLSSGDWVLVPVVRHSR